MIKASERDEPRSILLPETVDHEACLALHSEINEHCGERLSLLASQVEFLGGAGVELILATHAEWAAQGLEFQVLSPSSAFQTGVQRLGLSQGSPFNTKGVD